MTPTIKARRIQGFLIQEIEFCFPAPGPRSQKTSDRETKTAASITSRFENISLVTLRRVQLG